MRIGKFIIEIPKILAIYKNYSHKHKYDRLSLLISRISYGIYWLLDNLHVLSSI